MEIKLRFEPLQKVFVMFKNKVCNGIVDKVLTETTANSKEVYTGITYIIKVDESINKNDTQGFLKNDDGIISRSVISLSPNQVFETKEELLANL